MTEYRLPNLIVKLVECKIPVIIEIKDGELSYKVEGFYKSDTVSLHPKDGYFLCVDRYNEEKIVALEDLVGINYRWWLSSKDNFSGWIQPDPIWVSLLKEFRYIEEVPATVRYKPRGSV